MKNIKLANENAWIGPPKGWDPAIHGECLSLSCFIERDEQGNAISFTSMWQPSAAERELVANGAPFQVTFKLPFHPVVQMGFQDVNGELTEVEGCDP